jgi:chromatin segregation and condensation protein Rec8/ScpA/Scc1 (kleisin family)
LLLTLQEPPAPPKAPGDFVPPPLFLPLRHELTSTTIQHLLEVLDDVLKGEKLAHIDRVVQQPVLPSFTDLLPQFDAFLQEIELQMDKLYELLLVKVQGSGIIEFGVLAKGKTRMEAVQMFILLLFLAQDGKVSLLQNEETEEMYIAVGNVRLDGTGKAAQ